MLSVILNWIKQSLAAELMCLKIKINNKRKKKKEQETKINLPTLQKWPVATFPNLRANLTRSGSSFSHSFLFTNRGRSPTNSIEEIGKSLLCWHNCAHTGDFASTAVLVQGRMEGKGFIIHASSKYSITNAFDRSLCATDISWPVNLGFLIPACPSFCEPVGLT